MKSYKLVKFTARVTPCPNTINGLGTLSWDLRQRSTQPSVTTETHSGMIKGKRFPFTLKAALHRRFITFTGISHPTAGAQKSRTTKFCTICGSSLRNLLHGTLLAPRILWFPQFCNECGPLGYSLSISTSTQFPLHSKQCISITGSTD
jgi:hypothetical protein